MNSLIVFRDRHVDPVLNPPFFPEALEGEPTTWAWRLADSEDGLIAAGIWKSTPGVWRMDYTVWEFCHLLEGSCTIAPSSAPSILLQAGDTFVCQPGLTGTWQVHETMRKAYVVRRQQPVL